VSKSALEAELALQIKALGLPEPVREYRAIKGRKFRFDFAWLEHRLLVEIFQDRRRNDRHLHKN